MLRSCNLVSSKLYRFKIISSYINELRLRYTGIYSCLETERAFLSYNTFRGYSNSSNSCKYPSVDLHPIPLYKCYMFAQRSMAGHAKWQNVKHTKQAKDMEKSKTIAKFIYMTRVAVREGGHADPKYNTALRNVLADAQKCNVPLSSLESAMKKASNPKTKVGFLEIFGPNGSYIILEYETDNISEFRHDVKVLLKKYATAIVSGEGRWRAAFEQKGLIIVVGKHDNTDLDAEKALESAIEAGAEDVQLRISEDDQTKYLEFICDPTDLHAVKKALEGMDYRIEDAYVAFIPTVTVPLSGEAATVAENLLSDLDQLTDVVRVYENMKF